MKAAKKWRRQNATNGMLCLPQIKPEHIGDAVHPGSDGTECVPLPRRHVKSARPCSTISECACHCTTRRRNAHGIAERELLYPWHPWAGCLVHVHEVVEKAGREIFRCSLSGRATGRWLEIPGWMFDRAAGAAWRVGAAPYVDIAVLTALATLLQDVTSVSGAPSQFRDSSAALGSHDANRGDVHAAPAYRSSPSSQQCTSVRSVRRPALRRGADAEASTVFLNRTSALNRSFGRHFVDRLAPDRSRPPVTATLSEQSFPSDSTERRLHFVRG
jgi:hypothetical protein